MIYDGALTWWSLEPDGERWQRQTVAPVRCDLEVGTNTGQPGPELSRALKAYVPGAMLGTIKAGDYAVAEVMETPEPPARALRVSSVQVFTIGGLPHHTEVMAQ